MEDLMLHVDCFGDSIRIAQDHLESKNFYACNPSFDKNYGKMKNG